MIEPEYFRCTRLLFLALLAVSISGCRTQSREIVTKPSPTLTIVDKGDFKFQYEPQRTLRKSDDARTVDENEQAIAALVADLNNKVALPFDIFVSWSDCEEPDAYYESETRKVVICYQLIEEYNDLFATNVKNKPKRDEAVRGAIAGTFFHELGHALIDVLELPITGKEEDAADQLSTIVLMNRTESGEQMALDRALSFRLYADFSDRENKIYWSEHSLDEQRFYDTICMIYGHNPRKYEYLIANGTLPEERAVNCKEDFNRIDRS